MYTGKFLVMLRNSLAKMTPVVGPKPMYVDGASIGEITVYPMTLTDGYSAIFDNGVVGFGTSAYSTPTDAEKAIRDMFMNFVAFIPTQTVDEVLAETIQEDQVSTNA